MKISFLWIYKKCIGVQGINNEKNQAYPCKPDALPQLKDPQLPCSVRGSPKPSRLGFRTLFAPLNRGIWSLTLSI